MLKHRARYYEWLFAARLFVIDLWRPSSANKPTTSLPTPRNLQVPPSPTKLLWGLGSGVARFLSETHVNPQYGGLKLLGVEGRHLGATKITYQMVRRRDRVSLT